MHTYDMIINGRAVPGAATFEVVNPATGAPFARVAAGDASHVDAAVEAARAAFPAWSRTPDERRQALIGQLADLLETHMAELMELLTRESGKPLIGLDGIGSQMEVGGAIAWTRVTGGLSLPVEVIQDDAEARVEVHRKPLGVVGSITPWNWPLMIAIWHVIPALRAGNTVVLKPAEATPVATARFVALANGILPPGVLNVVTGTHGSGIGSAIAGHPGIDKIVFTGSTPTGKRIMGAAAGNLKRLTLELGGNDAGIVLPDVDPAAVARKIFKAAFHNNGQTCACLKRLYVHESLYEALCNALAAQARAVVVGDGMCEGTELGPLQNEEQRRIVQALADDARARGARLLAGGGPIAGPGYFFQPTIVADLSNGTPLVDEEQFGPILPVIRYRDIDEAIALANDNPNGLGGSIWSNDIALASTLARRLECGTAWVNEHGAIQPDAPFGGVKQSGIGVEFGLHGLAEYTSLQTVKIMKC
ncbi:aldehyde dehydrogenase family protein [Castellaniella defragrans]|uniref:Acyl-CoA reductase-like NAD-dependent aldehyde dehydrogenase n=1 Tax=Castellaniella defragrans TaxID=75697 RepID=A0A7W9TNA1_CASDE|nr:aldehyde dehydrogenase family protein [Castellaniella defragrans]KAB0622585.1 aldehyde dehydrogenase family protein [Castellaniella defragrans]MBB6082993.1 acyl-CoA reductase-like NAD-dependent aldehyde dehydrogenase [Castellaniella defragrans]